MYLSIINTSILYIIRDRCDCDVEDVVTKAWRLAYVVIIQYIRIYIYFIETKRAFDLISPDGKLSAVIRTLIFP